MFRQLVTALRQAGGLNVELVSDRVLAADPAALAVLMEEQFRLDAPAPPGSGALNLRQLIPPNDFAADTNENLGNDHLIYAYMVENTRVYEIVDRILREYFHGERLEVPSPEGQRWLRATEELFFRDHPALGVWSLASYARPDSRATRRNAYWRMFGMDLNHGTPDNRAYPFEKPQAANREFVNKLEEFLREVWRGIENASNTSGINPTDPATIADLAEGLRDMLAVRRRNGNLLREEFLAVAVMSWLHVTVSYDSPIVRDLKSEATSPEERLRKMGERVGLPSHGRSEQYFELAERLSPILLTVQDGLLSVPNAATATYLPGNVRDDMQRIIMSWSIATGRDMKARKVTSTPRIAPTTNGRPLLPA